MTKKQPIPPYDWFANQFTIESRQGFVEQIGPHLKSLLAPEAVALDLCCGAGPLSFLLEELGAYQVTGIDFSPYLITLARDEAASRGSAVNFVQADILQYPLEKEKYDLILCIGNAILDFPHRRFLQFQERIFRALRPGGFFVLEYMDGLMRVAQMREPAEVVEEGLDSQIRRRFLGYDPVQSTYQMEYTHLASQETYVYTGYVYTRPFTQLIMETNFEWKDAIELGEKSFIDIYIKREFD